MKHRFISIVLSFALLSGGLLRGEGAATFPFRSVMVAHGTVVATLPRNRRWLVQTGSSEPRLSKPGESFTLQPGDSLSLSERHSSYSVSAQSAAPAGLQVEATFDTRSMGGDLSKKSFFIPAHRVVHPRHLTTRPWRMEAGESYDLHSGLDLADLSRSA